MPRYRGKISKGAKSLINNRNHPAHHRDNDSSEDEQEIFSKRENHNTVLGSRDLDSQTMATNVATYLPTMEDVTDKDAGSTQTTIRNTPLDHGSNHSVRRKTS